MRKYIEISKALMPASAMLQKTYHTTFIVRKGRIQKIGMNNTIKTHPLNKKYRYLTKDGVDIRDFVGTHSELSAVLKYGREDCSDCVFINVRIDKNGNPTIAAPCHGCQDMLRQIGYKKVYYTNKKENLNSGKTMANVNLSKDILENAKRAHYNAPINLENGINLVLMCSSGVDSIAATHFMMKRDDSFFTRKIVCHVNHNLREQNDKMEESVKLFCTEMGFEFVSTKVNGREKELKMRVGIYVLMQLKRCLKIRLLSQVII